MQIFWHRKCKVFGGKERNLLIYSISTEMRKMKKKCKKPSRSFEEKLGEEELAMISPLNL